MTDDRVTKDLAAVKLNREAVAVFADVQSLEAAIDALRDAGFSRAQISLLAEEKVVDEKVGASDWTVESLEDDPDAPRAGYVSKEAVAAAEGGVVGALVLAGTVGVAAATVAAPVAVMIVATATAGAAAAALGGALAALIGEKHAAHLEDQLRHGGLLLWVRTVDADQEARAVEILRRCSGRDVHVHGEAQGA